MADGLVHKCWILFALFLAFAVGANTIYVQQSTGEVLYLNTPTIRFGTQVFNVTGARLILADPLLTFCAANEQNFTDRIVLMGKDGCSPTTKIQLAKSQGAAAIIMADFGRVGPAGNLFWRTTNGRWADEDQVIPGGTTLYDLIKNDNNDLLQADVDSNEYNSFRAMLESNQYVVLCALIIAAAVAGLGFVLSRFVSLLMTQGCTLTTGHFALSFISGGFVTMVIYFIVHLIDIKVGPVAPEPFYTAFLTFPELFTVLSCLIVSLYWFELINSVTSRPILFLNKLFKPFIGIAIALTVVWIFINLAAGFFLGDTPFLVFALIFLLITVMVVIIWLIVGIKLLKAVHASQKMTINAKKQRSFNRLAVCIILCAAFFLTTRVLLLLLTLLPSLGEAENWIVVAGAIFFGQLATLFIQTGLFKMQKRDFKTSGASDSRGDIIPSGATTPKSRRGSTTVELSGRTVERINTVRSLESPNRPNVGSVGNSSSTSESSPQEGAAELNGNSAGEKSEAAQMPEIKAGTGANNNVSSNEGIENEAQIAVDQPSSTSSSSSSSDSSASSSDSEVDSGSESSNESYDKTDSSD